METRRDRIISQLSTLRDKQKELLREGRKYLFEHSEDSDDALARIFAEYQKLRLHEEFCEYSLMLDYVLEE